MTIEPPVGPLLVFDCYNMLSIFIVERLKAWGIVFLPHFSGECRTGAKL
jgi:hypothetical protein